jgi:hypothetical protein
VIDKGTVIDKVLAVMAIYFIRKNERIGAVTADV